MRSAPADNIFGRILSGELPCHEVYSDEESFAFLDIFPQNPGHTLVIPRSFSENLIESTEGESLACLRTVRKLMPAVRDAVSAAGVTVLTNTGLAAGQSVPYLHFHIVPRFTSDKVSLYKPGEQLGPEEGARLAKAIRELL